MAANMTEEELVDRAIGTYARECEREGVTFEQPSSASSRLEQTVDGDVVILENINGPLAAYMVHNWLRVSGHELEALAS